MTAKLHPPFAGVIETLASFYDLQHTRRDVITYPSPSSGAPVSLSLLMADTIEEAERRTRSEELLA